MSGGPDGVEAARAAALLSGGLVGPARGAALRALRSDPSDSAARYTLARALLQSDAAEEAHSHLRGLLTNEPQNADALRLFALASLETGRPSVAMDAAQTAVRIDPRAWQSHAVLAQVEAHANGRPAADRAIAAADAAVRLAPEIAGPHAMLGEVCLQLGRYRRAEKALRAALALEPHNAATLQNLGAALEAQGKAAAAINVFGDLAGAQPGNPVHTRNIGATFARWVSILLLVTLAWFAVVLRQPLLGLSEPGANGARTTYLLLALAPSGLVIVGAIVFAARSRHRPTSLWAVLRREAAPQLRILAALGVIFVLLPTLPMLPREMHTPAIVGAGVALVACLIVVLRAQQRRAREEAAAQPPLADGEEARPLTFREDLARAQSGLPPTHGPDGKPVLQPWVVGPLMYIGFACSVLSLVPLIGLGLGLAGFLFCNAAWAHLRHAQRPRVLPLVGQVLGALGFVIGIVSLAVLLSQS